MKKKIRVGVNTIFYVIALLFLFGFIVSCYNVTTYIVSLIEEGSITFLENWMDVTLYYFNNTSLFLAMAILIGGMGYALSLLKKMNFGSDNSDDNHLLDEKTFHK